MEIITKEISLKTKKDGGMHNITDQVEQGLENSGLEEGHVLIFCIGSTCSVSTVEFEPGLLKDVPEAMEKIAPKEGRYFHHETWHDDNGRSHVKATIMGPSLCVPFYKNRLILGDWQQIVFLEWDTTDRNRKVVFQFLGKRSS